MLKYLQHDNLCNVEKIILVDPSLKNSIGHSEKYALEILEQASFDKIESIVLCNKSYISNKSFNSHFIKIFTNDIWSSKYNLKSQGIFKIKIFIVISINLIYILIRKLFGKKKLRAKSRFTKIINLLFPEIILSPLSSVFEILKSCLVIFNNFLPNIILNYFKGLKYFIINVDASIMLKLVPKYIFITNPSYYFELKTGFDKINLKKNDLVFFHMLVEGNLLETLLSVKSIFKKTAISPVLLFRYPEDYVFDNSLRSKYTIVLMEELFEKKIIRFATDSFQLAKSFSFQSFVPFEVFPIPNSSNINSIHTENSINFDRQIIVGCFGNPREEKGFTNIVSLIKSVFETEEFSNYNIKFLIQTNNPDKVSLPLVSELKILNNSNLELIEKPLSDDDYNIYFQKCDIILAPYLQNAYKERTSGITVEAMVNSKIIISVDKTWMSDQMDLFNCGVVLKDDSFTELRKSFMLALVEYDKFKRKAIDASVKVKQYHNSKNFMLHLTGERFTKKIYHKELCFLYPWSDLFDKTSGAAIRSGLMLELLENSKWKINFLGEKNKNSILSQSVNFHEVIDIGATLSNPIFLFSFINRVFFNPLMLGLENMQFRFKYWYRSRDFKIILNKVLYNSVCVNISYPFIVDIVEKYTRSHGLIITLDIHDIIANQTNNNFIRKKILSKEINAINQSYYAYCINEEDVCFLKNKGCNIDYIPNSFDLDSISKFTKTKALNLLKSNNIILPNKPFGLFIGSAHPPNIEAVHQIVQFSKDERLVSKNFYFLIVGNCNKDLEINDLHNCMFLGKVSTDILSAIYSLASFVISPLKSGTGASVKILEAFAFSKIVIGSSISFRSFEVEAGKNCLIANDLDEFIECIVKVLDQEINVQEMEDLAKKIAVSRNYKHTYKPVVKKIESHYNKFKNYYDNF